MLFYHALVDTQDEHIENRLTGMELRPASTSKNFPNPPAGSNAILSGPPTPYKLYAIFQVVFVSVPLYNAAPKVCTSTVGTRIPIYVARNILFLGVFMGILTL